MTYLEDGNPLRLYWIKGDKHYKIRQKSATKNQRGAVEGKRTIELVNVKVNEMTRRFGVAVLVKGDLLLARLGFSHIGVCHADETLVDWREEG